MNHQPFEAWLFSEGPLDSRDQDALQEHLQTCSQCRSLTEAWHEVEGLFNSPAVLGPDQGFVNRFQARLSARREQELRRQVGIFLAGAIAATSLLAVLLGLRWVVFAPSMTELVTGSVYGISWSISFLEAGRMVLLTLLRIAPPVWLGLFVGAVSGLLLLWIYSVGKFRLSRIWRVA